MRMTLLSAFLIACSTSSEPGDGGASDAPRSDVPGLDAPTLTDTGFDATGLECMEPNDCVLLPRSCCGSCGQPTRDDIDSVYVGLVDAQRAEACAEPVPCPDCEGIPDPTLLPDCSMSTCTFLDLNPPSGPAPSLSACETSDDCVIRAAECCECGATINGQTVVALNREQRGFYDRYVCEDDIGCPECAPAYPDNIVAECRGEGAAARCVVIVREL